jgi:hypothetical protein
MAFIVAASRAISSPVDGSGTRLVRSAAEISATSALIAWTGCSARPTTSQVSTASARTVSGTPSSSSPRSSATTSDTDSVLLPTTITSRPPSGAVAATAHER